MDEEYVVGDFMSQDVVTASRESTVTQCAKTMQAHKVDSVIITQNGSIAGILTEKDIVRKAVAKELDCGTTPARFILTGRPITIGPEASLNHAMQIMAERRIKHLPVVHEGKLIGVISARDILKLEPSFFGYVGAVYRYEDAL